MIERPLPPPGRLVDIGAGRRLHMMALGEGAPTVVFESGGGGGSAVQDRPAQRQVEVPAEVGVPEINPVVVFTAKPTGKPAAL